MSRTTRVVGIATLLLALIVAFAVWWWFGTRAKPDAVGSRLLAGLTTRYPGMTVTPLGSRMMRVALPTDIVIDVRLGDVLDRCSFDPLRCSRSIDEALGDVDRDAALVESPDRSALRPVVTSEPHAGGSGYPAEPLVGSFELRYALVRGLASTPVTDAIADRLELRNKALKAAALEGLRQDSVVALEIVRGYTVTLYRAASSNPTAAWLVDPERMKSYAALLNARKLYAVIPDDKSLFLAAASSQSGRALMSLQEHVRGGTPRGPLGELIAYDIGAGNDGAMSLASLEQLSPER